MSFAATLSSMEMQIKDQVNNQSAAQINFLRNLVNINSGTSNQAGVIAVGEQLREEFEKLGFKTYWVEEPPSMHRAGTLIAERVGKKGKRILLIGHLDTVFSKDGKFQHFELKEYHAKGPGVGDDKGGLVVILYALKALQAVHALDDTTLTVVLTGDEEDSGKPTTVSRKALIQAANHKDVALDFEPAVTLATSTIARRGISQWTIEVKGNESHSATIFQKDVGVGAIFELARILDTMRKRFDQVQYLSFNPGIALGGTQVTYDNANSQGTAFGKQNVVAKSARVEGDFRYLSMKRKQLFETGMQAVVKNHLPGTISSMTFQDGMPAMLPTTGNLNLLKQYSKVSMDLGQGKIQPFNPGLRGAADIAYVAHIIPANLSGLGPVGIGGHTVVETVELTSLPIQTERAAILLYRLTQ